MAEKTPETQAEWGPQEPAPAPAPPKEIDRLLQKGVTTFGPQGFEIKTSDDLDRYCKGIMAARMAPYGIVGKEPPDVALARLKIALDYGASIGFNRTQALQYVYVVNNRPCVWGDGVLALALRVTEPPLVTYEGLAPDETVCETTVCVCRMRRKGDTEYTEIRYSAAEAKKSGLNTKDGAWQTYPKDMLRRKAVGRCAGLVAADALAGVVTVDEVPAEPTASGSGADATAARLVGG